jgi:CDP-diacylglycerol--glycerol-3-phosphate 3-phosphatidyltransferase/cardiolipin synthase
MPVMKLNAPNAVSLARLPLAVAFIFADSTLLRGIVIITAGLTDFIDGWIARHFRQRSSTGELLDPVTDKLFVLTVLITLLVRGQVLWWELLLLLLRDLYNTLVFVVLKLRRIELPFAARMSGKVVTVLQIATVFAFTVLPTVARATLLVTVAVSLYSIFDYTRYGLLCLRAPPRTG